MRPKFDDGADERIGFDGAPGLDVLKHRSLVPADRLGPGDALVDRQPKARAERLADRLRLRHHARNELARRRIAADILQPRVSERAHRIEARIAPELHPDFHPKIRDHGRLEAGAGKICDSAATREVDELSISPSEKRLPSMWRITPGARFQRRGRRRSRGRSRSAGFWRSSRRDRRSPAAAPRARRHA